MKNLQIIIKSIYKNSVKKFLFFFYKKSALKKQLCKKIKNKKITILKSPHIYKKAQEQFEKNMFKTVIKIWTKNLFQYLIFLKKLKNNAFSDCFIFIKYKINNNIKNVKFGLRFFNPTNFKINKYFVSFYIYKKQNKRLFLQFFFLINKINLFLKIFEILGEFLKYKKLIKVNAVNKQKYCKNITNHKIRILSKRKQFYRFNKFNKRNFNDN